MSYATKSLGTRVSHPELSESKTEMCHKGPCHVGEAISRICGRMHGLDENC